MCRNLDVIFAYFMLLVKILTYMWQCDWKILIWKKTGLLYVILCKILETVPTFKNRSKLLLIVFFILWCWQCWVSTPNLTALLLVIISTQLFLRWRSSLIAYHVKFDKIMSYCCFTTLRSSLPYKFSLLLVWTIKHFN